MALWWSSPTAAWRLSTSSQQPAAQASSVPACCAETPRQRCPAHSVAPHTPLGVLGAQNSQCMRPGPLPFTAAAAPCTLRPGPAVLRQRLCFFCTFCEGRASLPVQSHDAWVLCLARCELADRNQSRRAARLRVSATLTAPAPQREDWSCGLCGTSRDADDAGRSQLHNKACLRTYGLSWHPVHRMRHMNQETQPRS